MPKKPKSQKRPRPNNNPYSPPPLNPSPSPIPISPFPLIIRNINLNLLLANLTHTNKRTPIIIIKINIHPLNTIIVLRKHTRPINKTINLCQILFHYFSHRI